MRGILAIGIDALSPVVLTRLLEELPTFRELFRTSLRVPLDSVFPPDTIPAWASIYTGVTPARHGVFFGFDVFESDWKSISTWDPSSIRGRTFWDLAGRSGKRVCIVLPHMAYPPWPVNGVMVSRSSIPFCDLKTPPPNPEVMSYPQDLIEDENPSRLGGISGKHPGPSRLGDFNLTIRRKLKAEADFALSLSEQDSWDLFYVFFSWLDITQHYFWRYFDSTDPTYPGPSLHSRVIPEMYGLMDHIISKFVENHQDATIVVFGDHGHGMRPVSTVNINEVLRAKGYLSLKPGFRKGKTRFLEKMKDGVLTASSRLGLDHLLARWAPRIPGSRGIYTSMHYTDLDRSSAYLAPFIGTKSYSEGGIAISKSVGRSEQYEKVRSELIELILNLRHPQHRTPLVEWAKRREDQYRGPYSSAYPDIVFRLRSPYGVGWELCGSLFGIAHGHSLSSGGHKKETVFLLRSPNENVVSTVDRMTLTDIAPSILHLLGVDSGVDFDGENVLKTGNGD